MPKNYSHKHWAKLWASYLAASLVILGWSLNAGASQKTHTVFFEGEENELHVYRISGTAPGKTLLIVGGIQGDEPGGFLAADFFADVALEKGTLIVVPRANFPSILKQERQINQDMNRKFMDDNVTNYETKVVNVLKKLICESDCFINLHEGSGYYAPDWVGPDRNPARFGQSIIVDAAVLEPGDKGSARQVNLEEMARKVIDHVNTHIKDKAQFFQFNNHRTSQPDSIHKEQRRSATYYALNVCKIPAFGIESAKALPLEQKIRQHILAVEGFMALLNIVPQAPGIDLKKPEMQYMIISVNGSLPVVVSKMQHLKIKSGDTIQVHDIVANYERGLSVDVIGVGNEFNDMKKKLVISEPTRIEAKKDFYTCGSVFLDIEAERTTSELDTLKVSDSAKSDRLQYRISVNGDIRILNNYSHLTIQRGDKLVILDLLSGDVDPAEFVVNFKGFVGNSSQNSGEDRGYLIDTGADVLMPRFSLGKKGRQYHVVTTLRGKEVGQLFIDIQS